MILHLSIQNLILIDQAEINFGPGLNIITGETGSGKSAILTAIRLILGERADVQWIRKGTDLAIVEATVQGSITIDEIPIASPFIIRRELHRTGRSRCFIEDRQVTLQELRAIPIELIDQSASLKVCDTTAQRELLDTYGQLPSFAPHFQALRAAQKNLQELLSLQQTSQTEQDKMEADLQFIAEINWQAHEETALQTQHTLLTHAAELLDKTSVVTALLSEGSHPVLPTLKRYTHQIESLVKIEPKFQDCAEWLHIACLNLEEVHFFLSSYASNLELDPNKVIAIESRLGEIESIKRRFGTLEQVEKLRLSLQEKANRLSHLDEEIEQAQLKLRAIETTVFEQAARLTTARKQAAQTFAEAISAELKSLNLPDSRFAIDIQVKALGDHGQDEIRYLFAANPGQPLLSLDQCASGGELSRILFALKTALGAKENSTCLIFDEIDSNVGGKTAAILGAKLEKLSQTRQLICVTHFVQVAKCAMDHFLVSKKTTDSGALTAVERLSEQMRIGEYERMTGLI